MTMIRVAGHQNVGTRTKRGARRFAHRIRPFCESLEARRLLTIQNWIGSSSALWATAANWSSGPISSGDTLVFGSSGTNLSPNNNTTEQSYNLEFTSAGYTLTGNTVDLNNATAIDTTNSSGSNTINLPLSLTANATATVGNGSSLSLGGTLTSGAGTTLTETGGGALFITSSSSSFAGTLDDQGNVLVNGSLGDGPVLLDGGVLGGTGTITGPISATSNGGSLSPGTTFTAGSITLNSSATLAVGLNSLSSFDQVSSTGTVNLNGATLSVSLNYVPSATDSWVIVNDTNQTPIQGTFKNLPQGSTITENGITLQINYAAGTAHNEVTLSVLNPPVANPDFYTTPADTTLNVPAPGVLSNDVDSQGLVLHPILVSLPVHGTLALSDSGSFTYTPATGYSGPDNFTYEDSDGTLTSAPTTVSLVVNPVNLPPTVGNATYAAKESAQSSPVSLSVAAPGVLASAVSPENLTLTAAVVSAPSYGSLTLNANGSFSYTPQNGYVGQDSFTFIATDSNGLTSTPATVTINVGAVNVASTLAPSAFTVPENGSIFVAGSGVLANATNPSGNSLSAILLASTMHGSLSLSADGSFTYTPNANFSGDDAFTYEATDGTLLSTNTATISITVAPLPVAPTAGDASFSVLENRTLSIASPGLLLYAQNPNGDPVTVTVINGPLYASSFAVGNSGSVSYTPANDFSGTDSFSYFLSAGGLNSNVATVTLDVVAVPQAPVVANVAYSVNENSALNVSAPGVLANDVDPNGLTLSAVLQTSPTHGVATLNSDGSFVYTPNANFYGTDTFSYIANDGKLSSQTAATVTIDVNEVSLPPTAANQTYSVAENQILTVSAPGVLGSSTDPNNLPLTATLVNTTEHGVLALSPDGSFTYDPSPNFTGVDTFTFKASNGVLQGNLTTVTIDVSATTTVANTTAQLNSASVTGRTSVGAVTRITTPNFFGTTSPGFTVLLYAQLPGGSPVVVGQTTADAVGNYSVTSSPLADGSYAFSLAAIRPGGSSTGTINAGSLLIDTYSPVISYVLMIPRTGQIYVTFEDAGSGLNLKAITNRAFYSFTRRTSATPPPLKITSVKLVPPVPDASGPATVVLRVARGERIIAGRYLMEILSGGITDVAGNPLDGKYSGQFPTGNGLTGSSFEGLFRDNGHSPNLPVATTSFVPIITAERAHAQVRHQAARPLGPLVHLDRGRAHRAVIDRK